MRRLLYIIQPADHEAVQWQPGHRLRAREGGETPAPTFLPEEKQTRHLLHTGEETR